MLFPDWQAIEQKIFETGKDAIEQFAKEHSEVMCSFFACQADPLSGNFAFSFDTPENAAHEAIKRELMVHWHRKSIWKQPKRAEVWRYARTSVSSPLFEYVPDTSLFQYPLYAKLAFDWLEFRDGGAYPEWKEGQDHYLEGQTILVIWGVIERLIAEKVFVHLRMTSPFRVGYQFPEDTLVILHFLNWPAPGGQTFYSAFDHPLAHQGQKQKLLLDKKNVDREDL